MAQVSGKHLLIHCGLHKTGTSYLQHVLSLNRARLAKAGVVYPQPAEITINANANATHHNHLVDALKNTTGDPQAIQKQLAPIGRFMDQPEVSTVVISGEEFGHLFLDETFRTPILAVLARYNLRLIYYLRRQDVLKESVFAEVVKGLYCGPIETENHYQYDLMARFEPLFDSLGAEKLILRPYNRALWPGQNIIGDFREYLGLPANLALVAPRRQINASLPRPMTYLLSRTPSIDQKTRLKHFHRLNPALFEDPYHSLMTPEAGARFMGQFTASNAVFAHRAGIGDINHFLGLDADREPHWQPLQQRFHDFANRWLD